MRKIFLAIGILFSIAASAQLPTLPQKQVKDLADSLLKKQKKLGWYDVTDYGLVGDGSTDNTTALQNLLLLLKSAGARNPVIYFPNGHYKFSGSLKTSDGLGHNVNNAQVYIPYTDYDSSAYFGSWTFLGESSPNHFGNFSLPGFSLPGGQNTDGGVILESTILDAGTLIGEAYADDGWGPFNFNKLNLENIHIRLRSKTGTTHVAPTMGGIDASKMAMFTAKNVKIDTQSPCDSSVAPATTSFGIRMPDVTNWGQLTIDDIYIQGVYTGLKISEHTVGKTVWIHTCYRAVEFGTMYHPAHFDRLLTTWSHDNIYVSNNCYVNIDQWDIEDYVVGSGVTSRWYDLNYDLNEVAGTNFIEGKYFKGVSGAGGDGTIAYTTNSSNTNIKLTRIGTGSSGSSSNNYDSLLVDGTSTHVPFSFFAATRKLKVVYAGNTYYYSPSDSTVATTYADNFNRTDASPLGDMSTAPSTTTWQYANSADWRIVSNGAKEFTSNASGSAGIRNVYVNTSLSNATVKADITYSGTQTQVRLITRYQDESNYVFAAVFKSGSTGTNQIQLYKLVGGSFTQLGSTASVSNSAGTTHEIKLVASGSSLTVYNDGVSVITATDGALSSQTKHGFGVYKGAGASTDVDGGDTVIDNFSIQ